MSLSDKILEFKTGDGLIHDKIITADSVRKAVKELKDKMLKEYKGVSFTDIKSPFEFLDEIFGEKLV